MAIWWTLALAIAVSGTEICEARIVEGFVPPAFARRNVVGTHFDVAVVEALILGWDLIGQATGWLQNEEN